MDQRVRALELRGGLLRVKRLKYSSWSRTVRRVCGFPDSSCLFSLFSDFIPSSSTAARLRVYWSHRPLASLPPVNYSISQSDPHPTQAMVKKSTDGSHRENANNAEALHRHNSYGGNPLAHIHSADSVYLPAFGGAAQPGLYKPPKNNFANPAPLGLSGFALTTFLLSAVNLGVRDLASPAMVIAPALAYGGFVQLLAGMWEIAVGKSLALVVVSAKLVLSQTDYERFADLVSAI